MIKLTIENTTENQNQDTVESKEPVINIKIAGDYYSATISVDPNNRPELLTHDLILSKLKERSITVGIDLDLVDSIVKRGEIVNNLLIAKGKEHSNGKNGEIIYHVDINHEAKPTVLEDGSVDFKHLNAFQTVKTDQLLAEKIDPTEGEDGLTVTGKVIKGKMGKIVNFKFGKNCRVSEDGSKLFSETDGTIKVEGERLSVIEVLTINGDVGIKTGNVEFKGKIVVTGNVTSGYEINCEGDLEIQGLVESAVIRTTGDCTIGYGIQGNDKAVLEIGGNLISKFVNNCSATVGGKIQTDAIMHSKIVCDQTVMVIGRKGLIVGGEIKAMELIKAVTIGSDMGTQTKLSLGVDSKLMERYQFLTEKIKELKDNIKKLDQALAMIKRQASAAPENQQFKAMMNKTKLSKIEYHNEMTGYATELRELQERINKLQNCKVIADVVHPGAKVTIGHSHYNVKQTIKNAEIYKKDGEIYSVKMD